MTETNLRPKRILAVLAHPDDEAFGMGGTLAHYAKAGVQVFLICATLGEAGMVAEEFLRDGQTVAQVRGRELECSAQALGLQAPILLGYRDSGMQGAPDNQHPNALIAQPLESLAAQVAAVLRELHPDLVLTFDPLGGYQHPDHIFIHRATTLAFEQYQNEADAQPARLYFHVMPKQFIRTGIWLLRLSGKDPRKFGANGDIDLTAIAKQNFSTHVKINYKDVAAERARAAACHASQGGGTQAGLLAKLFSGLFSRPVDCFMQAYPEPALHQSIKTDFWEQ